MSEAFVETSKPQHARVLVEARMKSAEYARQDFVIDADEGTTREDILRTDYWAHVSPMFKPFDHLDVREESGAWVAQLLVVDSGRNWAKVHVMQFHDLHATAAIATPADRYKIEWKGTHHKYSVIRLNDNAVVQNGFGTKDEAAVWLKGHETIVDKT
jgi:hypothetical protein